MHPNNRYRGRHDFSQLSKTVPELADYVTATPDGQVSLDFMSPDAVRLLNRALLLRDYDLKFWDIPEGSLCPGVPGRLDYIHALNDLLEGSALAQVDRQPESPSVGRAPKVAAPKSGNQSEKKAPTLLDVGTGASLIYPILGTKEYGWRFIGTDVDETSLRVAGAIVKFNPRLINKVDLRRQPDRAKIFTNVIRPRDTITATLCNPPFFSDEAGAINAARAKWTKLGKDATSGHNFGGNPNELWTPGGEPAFLRRMIEESVSFKDQVGWFTTLVSKKGYLHAAKQHLQRMGAATVKVIRIGQGGKIRRILAWQF